MKNYEKPMALVNEELAEGVYMASGADSSSDCWEIGGKSVQDWNGSHNVFEMWASHSKGAAHITTEVVYTYTFSAPIVNAYSEFACTYSGNKVIVTRDLHANGYYSGDKVTFKVWVQAADEATTKNLSLVSATHKCRHEVNVQGGID